MKYPYVAGNLENITVSLCLGMATLSVGAYPKRMDRIEGT
jgi:hypothetical protein